MKEIKNNRGYKAESDALKHNISLRKQVAWTKTIVYPQKS